MRRIPLALFIALTWASPVALAQTAPPVAERPLGESLQGPASDAYTAAKMLLNNGDSTGALTKYSQAYELSRDPRLLFDMAICERNLRAYARMQSLLRQYEQEAGPGISPQDKSMVDDALAAIKDLVGSIRLTVTEAGAAVTVDGEAAGTTPLGKPLSMDLGKHQLVVTKAGFETIDKTLDIAGGSRTELAVTLSPQVLVGAHLLVTSDSEATVSIDGHVAGKGRFDGPLAPGTHEVGVSEADKRSYKAEIDLRPGEMRTLQVTLEGDHHAAYWPWLLGGAVVATGAVAGGYFLLKSQDSGPALVPGRFGTVVFQSWPQR